MDHIIDDYGRTAIAVGADGSIERVKVQRPRLIERLNSLYFQAYECRGRAVDEAIQMIRADGISSEIETNAILMASHYGEEPDGSVTSIVMRVAKSGAV
jgi:hypothetical protein